jgi:hypothetical protein
MDLTGMINKGSKRRIRTGLILGVLVAILLTFALSHMKYIGNWYLTEAILDDGTEYSYEDFQEMFGDEDAGILALHRSGRYDMEILGATSSGWWEKNDDGTISLKGRDSEFMGSINADDQLKIESEGISYTLRKK